MKKGLLIVFEGGEFVGKTTQQKRAKAYLEEKGYDVITTHEPGGGDPRIREKLLDVKREISPEEELSLFCEDRRLHAQNVIRPALEEGKIVLLDRFEYSTISYQGYGRGLALDLIKKKSAKARGNVEPDLVILLNANPAMVSNRAPAATRFEKEGPAFHRRVWLGFLLQAAEDRKRWRVIDATLPEEEVWQEVKKYLDQLISERVFSLSDA
jgi:dTMP kinase